MRIIIQLFEDDMESEELPYMGDIVASALSFAGAHDRLEAIRKGMTVPGQEAPK